MRIVLCLFFFCSGLSILAQDLKPLDYASLYRKHGIRSRTCREVRHQPAARDTMMIASCRFDDQGRMVSCTEYFAGGRLYAEYSYSYDASGRMNAAEVRHVFNQMIPVPLRITHDANGRVISFEVQEPIRNFWVQQDFTYNEKGILIRSEQWIDRNGERMAANRKEYPGTIEPRDNSLTHIHDMRGLEILHQFYTPAGTVDRSWIYTYSSR